MRLLLDTHLLLWTAIEPEKLPRAAVALLANERNRLYFSALGIWEVAIKSALKKKGFDTDPTLLRAGLLRAGYTELPIRSDHAIGVSSLPLLHKDPFDRLLIAQATVEDILLLTVDAQLAKYPGPIRKV